MSVGMLTAYILGVLLTCVSAVSVKDTRCLPVMATNQTVNITAVGNWSIYIPDGVNSTSEEETVDLCEDVCCADLGCHAFMLLSKETNASSTEFTCVLVNCGEVGQCVLTGSESVTTYMKMMAGNETQTNATFTNPTIHESTTSADVENVTTTGSLDLNTLFRNVEDVMQGDLSQSTNEVVGNATTDWMQGNTTQPTNETSMLEETTTQVTTTRENRVSIPGFSGNTTLDVVSPQVVPDTTNGSSNSSTLPTMHQENLKTTLEGVEIPTSVKPTEQPPTVAPIARATTMFIPHLMTSTSGPVDKPATDRRTTHRVDHEKDRHLLLKPRNQNRPVILILLSASVAMTAVVGLLLLVRWVNHCRKSRRWKKGYRPLTSKSLHI